MKPNTRHSSPTECPICGAAVPPRARACPECGADERTGWDDETTRYDGIDLPNDAFSPTPQPRRPTSATGIPLHWRLVALTLLLFTILGLLASLRHG